MDGVFAVSVVPKPQPFLGHAPFNISWSHWATGKEAREARTISVGLSVAPPHHDFGGLVRMGGKIKVLPFGVDGFRSGRYGRGQVRVRKKRRRARGGDTALQAPPPQNRRAARPNIGGLRPARKS